MRHVATLLRLVGELHGAARAPERWPEAWSAVNAHFGCEVLDGAPAAPADAPLLDRLAARVAQAAACADAGRCTVGRAQECAALMPQVGAALQGSRARAAGDELGRVAVDALPFPLYVCDGARRLLHANTAGHAELERRRWLRRDGERLAGTDRLVERRLVEALDAAPGTPADETRVPIYGSEGAPAELVCRPVTLDAGRSGWVLRLLFDDGTRVERLAALAQALGLSARQRELAGWLLEGCTLTEAAARMGIVRGTANDLLRRLFVATQTRRQVQLVGELERRLARG